MFALRNIAKTAIRQYGDRMSILIINDGYDDYIDLLSNLDHDFHVYQNDSAYSEGFEQDNVRIIDNQNILYKIEFDAFIVFGRTDLYEKAYNISASWHIPIIVIDTVSSATQVQLPFYASANIEDKNEGFLRGGLLSVGISDSVTKSWDRGLNLSSTIPIPAIKHERSLDGKILIDNKLPKEYIDSLSIDITDSVFTDDIDNANSYLHLWQNYTPLMINCMASKIPVITMGSCEWSKEEAFTKVDLLGMVFNIEIDMAAVDIAFDEVKDNSMEDFVEKWDNALRYVINSFYKRG